MSKNFDKNLLLLNVDEYLKLLEQIARENWICARILWDMGEFNSSLTLLHESLEKYLKVLWAKNETFKDVSELESKFKELFGHNIKKIIDALPANTRASITKILSNRGLRLYTLERLRYPSIMLMASDNDFSSAWELVKGIRNILGKRTGNLVGEYEATSHSLNKKIISEKVVKELFKINQKPDTKRGRKYFKREMRKIIERLQDQGK